METCTEAARSLSLYLGGKRYFSNTLKMDPHSYVQSKNCPRFNSQRLKDKKNTAAVK